ncbi:MAG: hypothetical protein P9M07_05555 [Candidatus Aceula meridiana]|nr:hypothetical protein [Candidatus Aceula meridiana]
MSGENQEIKIVGIDKDSIRISSDNKDYWVVSFKLATSPDQSWQKKFYEIQKKDSDIAKRKMWFIKDSICVEVSAVDDLQKVLDALKIEIAEVNVLCEQDHQKKIKIRQELATLQQVQRDATLKLKEDSDKLIF